jgi:ribA/ribD-fused uncharacterized protein
MDRSSYFIKDVALFGSHPTQDDVIELEKAGVKIFVDLTYPQEKKITSYNTQYQYIRYPITDRRIPTDRFGFCIFIVDIAQKIKKLPKGDKIYIHCKGGHGRSGVVVSVLLCYIFGLNPEVSMEYTNDFHSMRKEMREKWRKLGSPQTYQQKNFVYHLCKKIYFYKAVNIGNTAGFSLFTNHPVTIPGLGTFFTAEAALQAHKDLDNYEYVNHLLNTKNPVAAKCIGRHIHLDDDWMKKEPDIIYKILKYKFDQHSRLKLALCMSGLGIIVHHTKSDSHLGSGIDEYGENILGKQLTRLRVHYYKTNQNLQDEQPTPLNGAATLSR